MQQPTSASSRIVYWHRDLPPLHDEPLGEHVLEARTPARTGTMADEDWDLDQAELRVIAERRIAQEVGRLGGQRAHVLGEEVERRRNAASGERWLSGRYTFVLLAGAPGPAKDRDRTTVTR